MSNFPALDKVAEDIRRCYRCGYCRDMVRDLTGTFHCCPVREKLRHEHYSARGRNTIARGIMEGKLNISYSLRDVVYTCLSCDGCRDACSLIDWAKVDSPKINQAMREELHRLGMTPEKIRNVQEVKRTCGGPGNKATCRIACPLGQDVPTYVGLIARGRAEEALEIIRQTNPLPSICGKACTHPCEPACRQSEIGQPVSIQYLKRFAVDREKKRGRRPSQSALAPDGPKVAVVGSGPAGLSAANYLARRGFRVAVFEKDQLLGGMMSYTIPDFTLPQGDVLYDIDCLRELGIEIRTETAIVGARGISQLVQEGFQAVLLCVGTWSSVKMGLPGEDIEGVWGALEFLRRVKSGEAVRVGSSVVVVGGGKAALDSARTALRLGAHDVVIVYRRHREKAPFDSDSLLRALEEGVQFTDSVLPVEFVGVDGKVRSVRLRDAGTGVPAKNLRDEIEAQTVIIAIGQKPDLAGLDFGNDLNTTPQGTVIVDQAFRANSSLPIFAAGDVVTGPSSIVEAMASGRDAAAAIATFLRDSVAAVEAESKESIPVLPLQLHEDRIRGSRTAMPRIAMARRRATFEEVDRGFTNSRAHQEALRCLGCDQDRLSGLPVVEGADTLFFIGCNNYFRYPEVARAAVEVLAQGGMSITVTDGEQCCGSPAYWGGNTDLAEELQAANKALFRNMGIKKIITACADCYEMLGRHYDLGSAGIAVEHFAETVADLLATEKLRLKSYDGVITYHDPCQLARKASVLDQPRAVFSAIAGLQVNEMKRNKKGTQCCGGGPNSLVQLVEPKLAGEIAHERMSDARATGATALVTACSWCRTRLEGLDKEALPVYDLPYFIRHIVGLEDNSDKTSRTTPNESSSAE